MELEIYLIRHGESVTNCQPHLIGGRSGWADLTNKGRLQARLLNLRLKEENIKFDSVYSSTLIRARRTCDLGFEGVFPLEKVVESDQLIEMSQGKWEGQVRNKVYSDKVLIEMNSKGKFFIPANNSGESQRMIERRASNWFEDEILYNLKYQNKKSRVAVVGHSQWFRNLLHYVMGFNDRLIHRIKIDNTSVTKLYFDQYGWGIGPEFNDTSHLKIQNNQPEYDPYQGSGIVRTRGFAGGVNGEQWLKESYLDILNREKKFN